MNSAKKKVSSFPTVLVSIIAIFLFFVVFLGAFGFSFVKSKVLPQASSKITTLQQLTGGASGGLPSGSTVKTKAEGIAVCKQSGMDYCYPLVAVSFNDLGVCNQAPDKKACETEAKQLMQDFEDSQRSNGGGTP